MNTANPIKSRDQRKKFMNVLKSQSERNFIMWLVGFFTALRVSDYSRLKVSHFRGREHIYLRTLKTGKELKMLIHKTLKRAITRYIKGMKDDEYLFQSRQGGKNKPLTTRRYGQIMSEAGKLCKLRRISTHTPRKTFGYCHYQQFKDIAMLQILLGHSSEAVTMKYIGIEQDMIDDSMRKFKG